MQSRGIDKFTDGLIAGLVVLYLMTELLSILGGLNRYGIIFSWVLVLGFVLILKWKRSKDRLTVSMLKSAFSNLNGLERVGFFLLTLTFLILGIMAVLTVPYNWDSHTYHLTRIAHWMQDRSVDYFVTNNRRQLLSPVLAEYVLLHIFLITGSDLSANCLQYVSLIVCVLIAVHIMRKFHVSRMICITSSLLLITAPLMIGESLSTQVDLFAAMCLFLAADKILTFEQYLSSERKIGNRVFNWHFVYMSFAAALCYLAKPNICFSLALLLFWLFVRCIQKRAGWRFILTCALVGGLIVVLLPMPVFVRNIRYCGDPFGAAYMTGISVGSFRPKILLLNAYKNLAMLGVMEGNREPLIAVAKKLSSFLNLNLNDPRLTFGNGSYLFDANLIFSYDHDYAGAGFYVLISAVVTLLWMLSYPAFRASRNIIREKHNGYVPVLLLQFLASLCLIRWQPWVSRLLLPALSLTVIPFAIMLNEILSGSHQLFLQFFRMEGKQKGQWGEAAICFVLMLAVIYHGVQPVTYHMSYVERSISRDETRWELYFAKRPISNIYKELCAYAKESGNVGVYASGDAYEYPLWVKLKEDSNGSCNIENIVPGEEIDGFLPDCIIVLDQICTEYEYHGRVYKAVFVEPAQGMYSVLY